MLEKALAIIETLSSMNDAVGVSELCKLLDIPKTSAFFILNTLVQHRYITKTEDDKYMLGSLFIGLGINVLNKINIRSVAKPYMQELLSKTGFTVHLAVLDQDEPMFIEKIETQTFVKFSTYVGERLPIHASSVGKALASQLPEDQLDAILAKVGLPAKTENTITSINEFKAALETVRVQGYAVEDEEAEYGIRCIGAPIFNHDGKLTAAISITALRSDLPVQDIPTIGLNVKDTALQISEHLGLPKL